MNPLAIIMEALVAGAAAAGKDTVVQGVKDGYHALKDLIIKRFGSKADVKNAIQQVEGRPESKSRRGVLQEELETARIDEMARDDELIKMAQVLLNLLKGQELPGIDSYHAIQTGNGGLAQGRGSTAAGAGGIAVGGNVQGGIITGGEGTGRGKMKHAEGEEE